MFGPMKTITVAVAVGSLRDDVEPLERLELGARQPDERPAVLDNS
jgi:hypothetical protein